MNNNKFYIIIICTVLIISCRGKNADTEASPDINIENNVNKKNGADMNVEKNIPDIIEDLRMDIKKMNAELEYQHESLSKLQAQTQVWANPFAIYNKEIVLNNGS